MSKIFINFASIFIYIVAKIKYRVLVYVAVNNRGGEKGMKDQTEERC